MKITELTTKLYYHVTPTVNVQSILQHGLVPGSGKRSQVIGEQGKFIFLFGDIVSAEDAVANWLGDEFNEDELLTLLQVSIPENFPIKHDKAVAYEFFTDKKIPAENIKVINSNF